MTAAELEKMLVQRFARSAPIEEALIAIGMGKRALPTAEECLAWGVKLGKPEGAPADPASEPAPAMTAAVDRAMDEMKNLHPPLRRRDCERLIRAALASEPAPASTKCWYCDEPGWVCMSRVEFKKLTAPSEPAPCGELREALEPFLAACPAPQSGVPDDHLCYVTAGDLRRLAATAALAELNGGHKP